MSFLAVEEQVGTACLLDAKCGEGARREGADLRLPPRRHRAEPLNNQPWFGTDRVDRAENVRQDARPFHRDLVRYLRDLNSATADEALLALAAFLRERIAFAEEARAAAKLIAVERADDLGDGRASSRCSFMKMPRAAVGDRRWWRRSSTLASTMYTSLRSTIRPGFDASVMDGSRLLLAVEVSRRMWTSRPLSTSLSGRLPVEPTRRSSSPLQLDNVS